MLREMWQLVLALGQPLVISTSSERAKFNMGIDTHP